MVEPTVVAVIKRCLSDPSKKEGNTMKHEENEVNDAPIFMKSQYSAQL
jgi:hypothetical protein